MKRSVRTWPANLFLLASINKPSIRRKASQNQSKSADSDGAGEKKNRISHFHEETFGLEINFSPIVCFVTGFLVQEKGGNAI